MAPNKAAVRAHQAALREAQERESTIMYPAELMSTLARASAQGADIAVVPSTGTDGVVSYTYKVTFTDKYNDTCVKELDATYVSREMSSTLGSATERLSNLNWELSLLEEEALERARIAALRQSGLAKLSDDERTALGLK